MKKKWTIQIIRMLLIMLWIYAAGSKLIVFNIFAYQLARQPLPSWSIPIIQWLLPLTELFVAGLLCFQRTLKRGLLMSFLLMLIFTLYVGFGLAHVFNQVPCSCGGIISHASWGQHLVFNIVFTVISLIGWLLERHTENGDSIKANNLKIA